ncbi:hypothetical protein AL057_08765 [Pseudomonas amygdali pv. myricae]|nr:hypothetical protein AL057_08765 [Pseudomonas amygdali pv. myricae]
MPFRTLRVLLATQSVATCITTLERGNENLNYRASLCVACCSGRSASSWRRRASRPALPRWSVGTRIQLSCDAPRRMPFWTLCVLFAR